MEDLKYYLERRFKFDNHKRYHKYFEEWYENLIDNQLLYFEKDMIKTMNNGGK